MVYEDLRVSTLWFAHTLETTIHLSSQWGPGLLLPLSTECFTLVLFFVFAL